MIEKLKDAAIILLQKLIAQPSFSSDEDQTAMLILEWFKGYGIECNRNDNNIWVQNRYFDAAKPTLLLNSHHDTVKPNKGYTKDPFNPELLNGKLYGLGANDAGGCLVALMAAFVAYYDNKNLKYNLVLVASAEEESSGEKGLNSVLEFLPKIAVAIVGEPTLMQLAIAEKGLMVLDCTAFGKAGHAAHDLGENAIYKAFKAIEWIKNYQFSKVSETLGKVKMTVTQINAGSQHNVIPASCHFVVDVRVTDAYTNQEVLTLIEKNVDVEVKARSMRLNSSSIAKEHPLVKAGLELGRTTYGSPTLSDQAVLSCPSLKLGPGDTLRSHTADEFIYVDEIKEGIQLYIDILKKVII